MKKFITILIFTLVTFNSAYALTAVITPPTCPTTFPTLPLTHTRAYSDCILVMSPIINTDQVALYVHARNKKDAMIRANNIIAGGLRPYTTIAQLGGEQGTYFCAYVSPHYVLNSDVIPEAAIYWMNVHPK